MKGEGKTTLELLGLHRRKVLQRLAWLRRSQGRPIGDTALWTIAIADVAASIYGPALSLKRVEGIATRINVPIDEAAALRSVDKATAEMVGTDGFRAMTSKTMGALVDLQSWEKAAIGELLKLKRISILAVDHADDRRERNREAEALRRANAAAASGRRYTPRKQSKAVMARRLEVDRSTLFRREKKADATNSWTLPVEGKDGALSSPRDATNSWTLPGEVQRIRGPYHRDSNGHETVASTPPVDERTKNGEAA